MLNYPTLILVLIVFTTVTTLLLIAAALPADALGEQRLWALGNVCVSVGFAVGSMTRLPDLVHAGVNYGLIGLGLALAWRGVRLFCGRELAWSWVAGISFAAFAFPAYFALVVPDKAARLVVSGLFLGSICWASAWSLWRGLQGAARSVMWASLGGFATIGLVMYLRAGYLLVAPLATVDATLIETIAGVSLLAAAVAQVMVAFGLTMLVSHRYSERLNRLTLTDGLTGVLNRVGMDRLGERMVLRAGLNRRSVSVVMVDADNFKAINDSYGHPAGDLVLVHLARLLSEQVRPGDLVIRYGGEEFVLVLDDSGLEAARQVAERLRGAIQDAEVATGAGAIRYRVSIGVSCSDTSGYELGHLLTRADAALYRAKQEGRNRVCVN